MKIVVELENNKNCELNNLTFLNAIIKFIDEYNRERLKYPTLFKAEEVLDFSTMAKIYGVQEEFCAKIMNCVWSETNE